ncbi:MULTISPECIES: heavy metal sensor histidine kinase [Pseudomonas]|uniref:Sensor protein n=1 Tax=Pseudomonas nitroreducens TaxID=46680 RepID=A0A6G6J6X8_PSENT|nr:MULTISPECIES: heavy metal sensor histidine kinase [Pseudomonas]QIE91108.1 heavy metal sensor histidine kinase [Pseudomonas nitroreducens]UCL90254.1 heavy metal sensor histidine kinase [Pseudomonas sp. HS-18]
MSLATRLGVNVGLMTAILVAALAVVCYFLVAQGLERSVKSSLRAKMVSVAHSVSEVREIEEISTAPHILMDLALGHTNMFLNIYSPVDRQDPLLTIGAMKVAFVPPSLSLGRDLNFYEWLDDRGRPMLSVAQELSIKDGSPVVVYLTIDRTSDRELLYSISRTALIAYPSVLLLILLLAWWTVKQGLKPLNSFVRVASKVSTENLDHRLPTERLPAELGNLAVGINVMLNRLDDGVQQLSQFSDDLAHELRAPITNLMGKAQVALTRTRSSDEYREVLECCTEELDRLTRIVADMLFLAHVSHPLELVHFERVSLRDESERVADLFSLSAEECGVEILIEGQGNAYGNRLMIQRAISNLLSNSIRYCTKSAAVTIRISSHGSNTRVSVSNPGNGIPTEHLPRIFERFYRVDKSRARSEGGTGLGLAIVRSIMSLHQGAADVEVASDLVTTFHLDFPAFR